MTRSFLKRSAAAIVPLAIGLALVWGNNSAYDKFIETYSVFEVSIVLACLIAFFGALALWVCAAIRPSRWPASAKHRVTKSTAIIALIAAACISGQRAEAFVMELPVENSPAVQIDQPFTLPSEQQRQVDVAIEQASKKAKDNPGFVVTVEAAVGIFIAAIVVGTVLIIIVRAVCKSLDRMRSDLSKRLSKIFPQNTTNPPAIIGAGFFNDRPATNNDLPSGLEFDLSFKAVTEPATLTGLIVNGETVYLDEFLRDFGVLDRWPSDSVTGEGVARSGTGYAVTPNGYTNFVTLGFESSTNLLQGSWKRVLNLTVPAGAMIDFADLTGQSEGRYWRVANLAK